MISMSTKSIEACWLFTLTKDKFRMKCSITVLERNESDEGRIKAVWNKLNEEELLVYKRALPGQEKKK